MGKSSRENMVVRMRPAELDRLESAAAAAGFKGRRFSEWVRRTLFAEAGIQEDRASRPLGRPPNCNAKSSRKARRNGAARRKARSSAAGAESTQEQIE